MKPIIIAHVGSISVTERFILSEKVEKGLIELQGVEEIERGITINKEIPIVNTLTLPPNPQDIKSGKERRRERRKMERKKK